MKAFGSEVILLPVYFIMLIVCGFLNFTGGSGFDVVNIIINICMFIIIGVAILWANSRCFAPVNRMVASMRYVTQTIQIDFKESNRYLWEKYQNEIKFFDNKLLDDRFNDYRLENKRLSIVSPHGLQCEIEDYINDYFIDSVIKKGLLSIIPGVMTGLGILGTFVGLSFGLQNFDTASAEAITNSIAPLMDGIKIAFHTSIYGMVFSLFFNFVFRKNLEDAYHAVDDFLDAYHKYVLPRTDYDNMELILYYQKKMSEDIGKMLNNSMPVTWLDDEDKEPLAGSKQ